MKNVVIIHPQFGQLLSQEFDNEQDQHKIYLNAIHSSLALKNPLTTFNGVDNLIHIPYNILKDCVIVGNTSKMTLGQYAVTKMKEGVM
jgi:hypothetical protein|tara:strand:- start:1884 stop:2147 length:264 start_codon:yes stop_codon:yes gene_type:complete